jgi:hypothetical protein
MVRGRRAAPGRRGGVGRSGGTTDDAEEDDEEDLEDDDPGPTSVDDLTQEADPGTFDRTFTDDSSPLSIAGNFDPTAGPKQAIPRVAFVLNFNLVYNPERNRWEPDTGNGNGGAFEVVETATAQVAEGTETLVSTALAGGDRQLLLTFGFPIPSQVNPSNDDPHVVNLLPQNADPNTQNADTAVAGTLQYQEPTDTWRIRFDAAFDISDPTDVEYKILEVTA